MYLLALLGLPMKILKLFILFILLASSLQAQTSFGPKRTIDSFAHDAQQVSSGDFDGDGDIDVVAIMRDEHRVSWYENLNGLGQFGPENIIATVNFGKSIFVADIDGDGDLDIASGGASHIYWHENNGSASFTTTHTVTTFANGAESLTAADLDGDGDIDLASVSSGADKLAWYENLNGLGTFGPQVIISTGPDYGEGIWSADLDGDLDIDLITASYLDDELAWYENLGNGNWSGTQIISSTQDGAIDVFAGDFDGDGDIDVACASWWDNTLAWFENTNGLGTFGPEQILSTGSPTRPYTVYGGDIDQDGDMDIVGGWLYEVGWFENTNGLGNFSSFQAIDYTVNDAHRVELADVDGDGDLDVLASTTGSDYVAWYENNPCLLFSDTLFITACDSYSNPSGTQIISNSGFYLDTLQSAQGCDSVLSINLSIYSSKIDSISVAACDSFYAPSGRLYTSSGNYIDSLTSLHGCDSLLYIDLNLQHSSYQVISIWTCDSFVSPSAQVYTQAGTYIESNTSVWSCDSILEINLTLTYSSNTQISISACNQFITPMGTVCTVPGVYVDSMQAFPGCDSLLSYVVSLTFINDSVSVSAGDTVLTAYANVSSYQWVYCDSNFAPIPGEIAQAFKPQNSGNYAVLLSQNGCTDTSNCYFVNPVIGLTENRALNDFAIYPNPNTGKFTLDLTHTSGLIQWEIHNTLGRKVAEGQTEGGGSNYLEIDQKAGIYFIRIQNGTGDWLVRKIWIL